MSYDPYENPGVCAAHGCDRTISPAKLMCGPHWFRVPEHLRRALLVKVRRQGVGSLSYLKLRRTCIDAVAESEGVS